jgi:sugar (pentulose or hexulose) kinase
MCQSETWPQLLSNVLNRPVSTPSQSEGRLLGAAICAAMGAGYYSTIDKATKAMVSWKPSYHPDGRADQYSRYYARWNIMTNEGD